MLYVVCCIFVLFSFILCLVSNCCPTCLLIVYSALSLLVSLSFIHMYFNYRIYDVFICSSTMNMFVSLFLMTIVQFQLSSFFDELSGFLLIFITAIVLNLISIILYIYTVIRIYNYSVVITWGTLCEAGGRMYYWFLPILLLCYFFFSFGVYLVFCIIL